MSIIYPLDSQKQVVVYTYETIIYLRIIIGGHIERGIILSNDYFSCLSGAIYNNTLYYSYINTSGDLIVKNIMDTFAINRIPITQNPDIHEPFLKVINQKLILFYFVHNPISGNYTLKAVLPIENIQLAANLTFASIPDYTVLTINTHQFLCISIAGANTAYTKALTPENIHKNILSENNNSPYSASLTLLTLNDNSALTSYIFASSVCNDDYRNSVSKEYDDTINMLKLALSEKEQEILKLDNKLQRSSQTIDSIQVQYTELMETALKYKEEAAKWYNKFCSGEHTL